MKVEATNLLTSQFHLVCLSYQYSKPATWNVFFLLFTTGFFSSGYEPRYNKILLQKSGRSKLWLYPDSVPQSDTSVGKYYYLFWSIASVHSHKQTFIMTPLASRYRSLGFQRSHKLQGLTISWILKVSWRHTAIDSFLNASKSQKDDTTDEYIFIIIIFILI